MIFRNLLVYVIAAASCAVADRKPLVEAIPTWRNAESGAEVVQLTSQPVMSTNVHMEYRFASANGRQLFGQYRLYRIGEIDLTTDDSMVWFGRSWATNLEIGSQLYFPGESNRWRAWVSLKFTGASYGGEGEDQVLSDRVILVRQEAE